MDGNEPNPSGNGKRKRFSVYMAGGSAGTGAIAGGVSEIANAVLQTILKDNPNLTAEQKYAVTQWVAAAVGAAVGGEQGAATSLDNVNYLNHAEILELKEAQEKCAAGDAQSCQTAHSIVVTDQARDAHLHQVCSNDGDSDACKAAVQDLASRWPVFMETTPVLISQKCAGSKSISSP